MSKKNVESQECIILHGDMNQGKQEEGTIVGIVIICAPTGVVYTVQAGGVRCDHPRAEGYKINLFVRDYKWEGEDDYTVTKDFLEALSFDCIFGCWTHWTNFDNKKQYVEIINDFFTKILNPNKIENLHFSFDHERIDELMEGWWPVLVQFWGSDFDGKKDKPYDRKFKGYLYLGNCD